MRLKFTYLEAPPIDGNWGLQDEVRQFFDSVKSRSKTTAEEGDALLERSLPRLSQYNQGAPLTPEHRPLAFNRRVEGEVLTSARDAIHNTLHEYEQRYVNSALGRDASKPEKTARQILFQEFDSRFNYRKVFLEKGTDDVHRVLRRDADGGWMTLGTLYIDNSRFVEMAVQEPGLVTPVYIDREDPDGRQYIRLPDDSFAKRYVMRGLSAYDGMRLWSNQTLIPTYIPDGNTQQEDVAGRHLGVVGDLNLTQQVLSHTRGWKKRFISTGTSKRDVYSTRGTQFHSLYGAAYIDLARITNQHSIVDVHHPEVARLHLGNADELVTEGTDLAPGATDSAKQKYLGLRDVVRTRELLIHGPIDFVAVKAQRNVATLVGLSAATGNEKIRLNTWLNANLTGLAPYITSHEAHDFRDMGTNRFWVFLAFKTHLSATTFSILKKLEGTTALPYAAPVVCFGSFMPIKPVKGT